MQDRHRNIRTVVLQSVTQSLKWPLVLWLLGYGLSGFSLLPVLNQKTEWHSILAYFNQVGSVISALGYVLFFYLMIAIGCNEVKKNFVAKHNPALAAIVSVVKKSTRVIFLFIALYTTISTLEFNYQSLAIIHKIIAVLLVIAVAWFILQVLTAIESVFHYQHEKSRHDVSARLVHLRYTKIHQIHHVAAFLVIVLAVAAALMVFDQVRSIGISILASAGFLTAILGLAAQKTLSSLFSGMQLALSQTLGIGDAVMVENEFGTIEELTLSYVIIRIWDGRRLILPVSYFIEKPFVNWSRNEGEGLQGVIKLYVDYTLPISPLEEKLARVLNESPLWDKKTATVVISDFKEYSIEVSIIVGSETPAGLRTLLPDVRKKILEFIRADYPEGFPRLRVKNKP